MQILFIHGNYPAQFRNIAADLGAQGKHEIKFLTARKDHKKYPLEGIEVEVYEEPKSEGTFYTGAQAIVNEQIRRAETIQHKILMMIKEGFVPKLILFHGGNGLATLIRRALPKTILIGYFEWYFSERCANLILNRYDIDGQNFIQARNICMENELIHCNAGIVPTEWQASQFPEILRQKLTIIFDGLDLDFFKPGNEPERKELKIEGEDATALIAKDDLLVTYATRGMEPLRGFTEFMRAIPQLLEQDKRIKVIIGGRDRSAYGPPCPTHNGSWKEKITEDIPILKDNPRIIYTGLMSYYNYRNLLQRTNLHYYLTKPFVTSWSLFEAIACGAPILCNRSEATSGTVTLDESGLIDDIEDVYKDIGIEKAMNILRNGIERTTLTPSYSVQVAKEKWADLINNCIIEAKENQN